MSYTATVVRAMIASPSDVPNARDAVEHALHAWNTANAESRGVIVQPWRWETAAVPLAGGHPQKFINAQGVDVSDIVFAILGGRLGSATPEGVSGTAEEIDRAVGMGKPVHLYFSTGQLPSDVDTAQLDALRAFKADMQQRALVGEFNSPEQLHIEVLKAIERDVAEIQVGQAPQGVRRGGGVDFLVQPHREREISGHRQDGSPRYSTNHWLDVTNRGSADAEQVTFSVDTESSGLVLLGSEGPTTIHGGQTRRLSVAHVLGGGAGRQVLRISWLVDGEERHKEFHVG